MRLGKKDADFSDLRAAVVLLSVQLLVIGLPAWRIWSASTAPDDSSGREKLSTWQQIKTGQVYKSTPSHHQLLQSDKDDAEEGEDESESLRAPLQPSSRGETNEVEPASFGTLDIVLSVLGLPFAVMWLWYLYWELPKNWYRRLRDSSPPPATDQASATFRS